MSDDVQRATVDWVPDRRLGLIMALASLVITVAGVVGYTLVWMLVQGKTSGSFVVGAEELLGIVATVVGVVVLMVIHELLHGLALRTLGHPAKYGVTSVGGVMPAFYCTSPGALMSRWGFTWVALLPTVVLAVAPLVWILADGPWAGWTILPAGVLLGGAVGDWAMTLRAWQAPRGVLVEDMREGLRLHLPH